MKTMSARLLDLKIQQFPRARNVLTLEVRGDIAEEYDRLKDKEVTVTIRPRVRRRSLDANAYAWKLMDQIAEALTVKRAWPMTAVEVYRDAILQIPSVSETLLVRKDAAQRLREGWSHNGIGWQSKAMPAADPGYVTVVLYYGSSTYDARQMGALIDYLISLAKELGVSTDTPEQIERYKYYWAQAQKERRKQ